MKIIDILRPVSAYILENTLDYWQVHATQHLSNITAKRAFSRGGVATPRWRGAEFNLTRGILTVPVPSALTDGAWDQNKEINRGINYKPKETAPYNRKLIRFSGMYDTSIQWVDFYRVLNDWFSDLYDRVYTGFSSKKGLIDMLFKELDVRFDCTCPSFYWQGMQYELSKINSSIERTNIPSKRWIPKHRKEGAGLPICKHIFALLYDMVNMEDYLYGLFTRSLKQQFPDIYDEFIAQGE